ncbi:DUF2797 domain-containing protein [Staphylospora marina]|uniref:DUF2797 domain-containing protein n=1 Tax=Staphylospora marina TaxID=2490858 RepID=UPI000F5BEC64|nr:DUF2797 domain-containing protein [Staphylospora marina]
MDRTGHLLPLSHQYGEPVSFFARVGGEEIPLDEWLGRTVRISFLGEIHCIHCGRKVKKTYNCGSCWPCFTKLAENDLCIVKPSMCHFERGTCRDPKFGEEHCMQPHIVYLALSSDVKVGITRKRRMVERWIDQGAVRAMPILEVPTRHLAGVIEAHLAGFLSDRTDWRKMLKNEVADRDLFDVREEVRALLPEEYRTWWLEEVEVTEIRYPEVEPPKTVKSISLDKQPEINGRLMGIKGQYLVLDVGVLNVRKHSGYKVNLALDG